MLKKVFPGIKLGECHQHARMKMDRDCARKKSAHGNWVDDEDDGEDETIDVTVFLKKIFYNVLSCKNELKYDKALMEFEEFTDLDPLLHSRWNSLARKRDEYLLCRKEIGGEKRNGEKLKLPTTTVSIDQRIRLTDYQFCSVKQRILQYTCRTLH